MIDFIARNLGIYSGDLIEHTCDDDTNYSYKFNYFDVLFIYADNGVFEIDRNKNMFGIIIENTIKISDQDIEKKLIPLVSNPFIGAVHRIK
jgi:hypothetical protein